MSESAPEEDRARAAVDPQHVRVVRLGHGANCSSIGSVVDTLFVASAVAGAVLAAVAAALRDGDVRIVGAVAACDEAPAPAPSTDAQDPTGT